MRAIIIAVTLLVLATGGFALTFGPFPSGVRDDPVFWNELGYELSTEGKSSEAMNAFARAVALDPSYENARKNLYVIAYANDEYLLSAEHAGFLAESEGDAQYHFDYAQALVAWARFQANDASEAVASLEDALAHLEEAGDYPHAEENAVIVERVLAKV